MSQGGIKMLLEILESKFPLPCPLKDKSKVGVIFDMISIKAR